jgi:hypothetical protein
MYRVAVIQNESEMLRSGFTNVIRKLTTIDRLSHYSFELFNCVNINALFLDGESNLNNFDSILITTNATSDKSVLDALIIHKEHLKTFLENGKGIFIGSQKKLSTTEYGTGKKAGSTGFLPPLYEFHTIERPKYEKDSGKGDISVSNEGRHILLDYPMYVTSEMTKAICQQNEFKRHYYRSHLIPEVVVHFHQSL